MLQFTTGIRSFNMDIMADTILKCSRNALVAHMPGCTSASIASANTNLGYSTRFCSWTYMTLLRNRNTCKELWRIIQVHFNFKFLPFGRCFLLFIADNDFAFLPYLQFMVVGFLTFLHRY